MTVKFQARANFMFFFTPKRLKFDVRRSENMKLNNTSLFLNNNDGN